MKYDVRGFRWTWVNRGLYVAYPGAHGPTYRLDREIFAGTGRHYWECWWCPEGWMSQQNQQVYLGSAPTHWAASILAELHDATQPDEHYALQLKFSGDRSSPG